MYTGIIVVVVLYGALIASIFLFQRHLMYHPVKIISEPGVYGLITMQELFLTSPEGLKLQTWMHPAQAHYPTIVYFHGNAFHLADRASKFAAFVEAGFGVVAVSYRGFGKSEGKPSEQGIYSDARAAIDYALEDLHVPPSKLIYFGESLGSGVAVQMATERAPGLLVLEAAYTSVETRSAELYPYVLAVRRLVLDKYNSLAKIAKVHAPLLMLHGEEDMIIPIQHGRALFAAANEPKTFIAYPGIHHADFSNEQLIVPLLKKAKEEGLFKDSK